MKLNTRIKQEEKSEIRISNKIVNSNQDFRKHSFKIKNINMSAKFIGRNIYWKLFSIENIARIIIHSVLSVQIKDDWWSTAVDPRISKDVQKRIDRYVKKPWHSSPGSHKIYFTYLPELNEIIRANSHLFLPIIEDIDSWIARFEQIRLPRNIVGHMNWLNKLDRMRVNVVYVDITQRSKLPISIP